MEFPTSTEMPPAAPLVAIPVAIISDPVVPALDVPVLSNINPEEPPDTAFRVRITTSPDAAAFPEPVITCK